MSLPDVFSSASQASSTLDHVGPNVCPRRHNPESPTSASRSDQAPGRPCPEVDTLGVRLGSCPTLRKTLCVSEGCVCQEVTCANQACVKSKTLRVVGTSGVTKHGGGQLTSQRGSEDVTACCGDRDTCSQSNSTQDSYKYLLMYQEGGSNFFFHFLELIRERVSRCVVFPEVLDLYLNYYLVTLHFAFILVS